MEQTKDTKAEETANKQPIEKLNLTELKEVYDFIVNAGAQLASLQYIIKSLSNSALDEEIELDEMAIALNPVKDILGILEDKTYNLQMLQIFNKLND